MLEIKKRYVIPGDVIIEGNYRPLMNVISTFIFTWLIIYAAITIKNKTWR